MANDFRHLERTKIESKFKRCSKCRVRTSIDESFYTTKSGSFLCAFCINRLPQCHGCHDYLDYGLIIKPNQACNCYYCQDCFKNQWRSGFTDRSQYPPSCCDNTRPLPMTGYEHVLDSDIVAEYHEKHADFSAKIPVYCAAPSCAKFLGDETTGLGISIMCTACGRQTCPMCRRFEELHDQKTGKCPKREKDVLMIDGVEARRCPNCEIPVHKIHGCDFVKCSVCKTLFCFRCRREIINGNYCNHDGGY